MHPLFTEQWNMVLFLQRVISNCYLTKQLAQFSRRKHVRHRIAKRVLHILGVNTWTRSLILDYVITTENPCCSGNKPRSQNPPLPYLRLCFPNTPRQVWMVMMYQLLVLLIPLEAHASSILLPQSYLLLPSRLWPIHLKYC